MYEFIPPQRTSSQNRNTSSRLAPSSSSSPRAFVVSGSPASSSSVPASTPRTAATSVGGGIGAVKLVSPTMPGGQRAELSSTSTYTYRRYDDEGNNGPSSPLQPYRTHPPPPQSHSYHYSNVDAEQAFGSRGRSVTTTGEEVSSSTSSRPIKGAAAYEGEEGRSRGERAYHGQTGVAGESHHNSASRPRQPQRSAVANDMDAWKAAMQQDRAQRLQAAEHRQQQRGSSTALSSSRQSGGRGAPPPQQQRRLTGGGDHTTMDVDAYRREVMSRARPSTAVLRMANRGAPPSLPSPSHPSHTHHRHESKEDHRPPFRVSGVAHATSFHSGDIHKQQLDIERENAPYYHIPHKSVDPNAPVEYRTAESYLKPFLQSNAPPPSSKDPLGRLPSYADDTRQQAVRCRSHDRSLSAAPSPLRQARSLGPVWLQDGPRNLVDYGTPRSVVLRDQYARQRYSSRSVSPAWSTTSSSGSSAEGGDGMRRSTGRRGLRRPSSSVPHSVTLSTAAAPTANGGAGGGGGVAHRLVSTRRDTGSDRFVGAPRQQRDESFTMYPQPYRHDEAAAVAMVSSWQAPPSSRRSASYQSSSHHPQPHYRPNAAALSPHHRGHEELPRRIDSMQQQQEGEGNHNSEVHPTSSYFDPVPVYPNDYRQPDASSSWHPHYHHHHHAAQEQPPHAAGFGSPSTVRPSTQSMLTNGTTLVGWSPLQQQQGVGNQSPQPVAYRQPPPYPPSSQSAHPFSHHYPQPQPQQYYHGAAAAGGSASPNVELSPMTPATASRMPPTSSSSMTPQRGGVDPADSPSLDQGLVQRMVRAAAVGQQAPASSPSAFQQQQQQHGHFARPSSSSSHAVALRSVSANLLDRFALPSMQRERKDFYRGHDSAQQQPPYDRAEGSAGLQPEPSQWAPTPQPRRAAEAPTSSQGQGTTAKAETEYSLRASALHDRLERDLMARRGGGGAQAAAVPQAGDGTKKVHYADDLSLGPSTSSTAARSLMQQLASKRAPR